MPLNKEAKSNQDLTLNNLQGLIYHKTQPTYKVSMGFGIDDLKVGLGIVVVFEYRNSSPQLLKIEEHNLDTCSRENALLFNIPSCQTI